jgi:hypothetical protein
MRYMYHQVGISHCDKPAVSCAQLPCFVTVKSHEEDGLLQLQSNRIFASYLLYVHLLVSVLMDTFCFILPFIVGTLWINTHIHENWICEKWRTSRKIRSKRNGGQRYNCIFHSKNEFLNQQSPQRNSRWWCKIISKKCPNYMWPSGRG